MWCADVEFAPGNWPKDVERLRYIAIRIRRRQQSLLDGEVMKYLAIPRRGLPRVVVSNRRELSAPELCRWHWQKAGTIEHIHDVTKNELAARVPPSGRFGANAAWYRLAMITYNVLSAMKSLAVPRLSDARPKRLRFSLFAIAGRLVSHADHLVLRIGAEAERIAQMIDARLRLAALLDRPAPA